MALSELNRAVLEGMDEDERAHVFAQQRMVKNATAGVDSSILILLAGRDARHRSEDSGGGQRR